MIRMITSLSAKQLKSYFNDALLKSDYFLNDQEMPGFWHGRIAARLGLSGNVSQKDFHALCDNINPVTGNRLTLRTNGFRRVAYDISFHAPKSVSVLHALTDDNHILEAFRECFFKIMKLIETDMKARVRQDGKQEDRNTGELLFADFIHHTARPVDGALPDVHLHCHCQTFNVTYDPIEQCYKAGEFGNIKRDMPYYQARFHKELSDNLIALGYQVRRTTKAFEVVGIPDAVLSLLSKRTNEIGQVAKAKGITDAKALDALGARTRAKKQKGLTMAQLKQDWRRQIMAAGMGEAGGKVLRFAPTPSRPEILPADCIGYALQAKFERASVAQDRHILEVAYRYAIGKLEASAERINESFRLDSRVIQVRDKSGLFCTTKEVLAEEKHMVSLARKGIGAMLPLYLAVPPLTLAGDQGEAAAHVLTTPDRVSIIRGGAGTGKTTLMQETVPLIEKAIGKAPVIVAPTAEAARGVLRREGFTDAETVAKLLTCPDLQKRLENGALWVDEAGLLGVQHLAALLALADKYNARVILAGDCRQMAAVARGDGLRILSTVAGIRAAEVNRIYRQRNTVYRDAVQALADGNIRTAFDRLDGMGAIKAIDPVAPYDRLADDYMVAVKKKKSVLAISPTHKEGAAVTAAIRHRLKQTGKLGKKDRSFSHLVNVQLTEVEKQDGRNYHTGQAVRFNRVCNAFRRGELWSVAAAAEYGVLVKDKAGNTALLPLDKANVFEVYNRAEIGLAKGDSIRITRNGYDTGEKRLNNGQTLEVTGFDCKGNIWARNPASKAEYLLPADYGHIDHAYCVTAYASQGKTVDEIFICNGASTFPATNLKQFYVSVSRARDAVHIYTDDKESLLHRASDAGDRVSAMELLQDKETHEAAEHSARMQSKAQQTKPKPVMQSLVPLKRLNVRPVI